MDKSKERAYEILRLYLDEAIKLDYITSIILVGSLSDDTYTGGPGSDIDLVHIVSDKADYKAEKETIFQLIDRINQQTNHDVPISKVVYQKQQLFHPYQTHKIRTGSSLWKTGSDFVFSFGIRIIETELSTNPIPTR